MTTLAAPPLSRRLVGLLAFTAGATVANLYYAQPLLDVVARDFGVGDGTAGLLVTASQLGYVSGLAFIVPLGDLLERRRLITALLLLAALACAVCTAAPSLALLAGALVALGMASSVAQIVVPLGALLADPGERGQTIGTISGGLLVGILGARTLSGVVAELGGWRLVFGVAVVAMLALAALIHRTLPHVEPTERLPYPRLLRSVLALIRAEPALRWRMALGACGMACFSMLWTAVTFVLARPPYGYSEAVIGLFGLAGLAGALAAPFAGRIADRGHGRLVTTVLLLFMAGSWPLLAWGGSWLPALLAGIVLLDLGMQGAQIAHQSVIYALSEDARSRIATAYMVSVFCGAVLGSSLAAGVFAAHGWHATCAVGGGIGLLALLIWAAGFRRAS